MDNAVGYGVVDPVAALTFDVAPGPRLAPESHTRVLAPPPPTPPRDIRARNAALAFAVTVAVGAGIAVLVGRARRTLP